MKTGLRYKFISIVLLAVVPFVVYAVYDYFNELNINKKTVIEHNEKKSSEFAREIEDFIDTSQNILYSLALHPALINNAPTCDSLFSQLLPLYPLHLNILAADMNGTNFASAVSPDNAHMLNYRDKAWFIKGSKGISVVTDLHQSKLFQQPAFMITMPVFAPSGQQSAVLGFPVNLYKLQEHFLTTETLGKQTTVSLFDKNSAYLLNTADSTKIGKPCKQPALLREIAGKQQGSLVHYDADGIERLYSFATVPATGWKVLVGIPLSEVYAEANKGALRHFFFFIAICLSGSLSAFYYSRKLGNKIEVLINGLNDVAGGNIACRVPVDGNDELSRACDAFNRMTAERQKAEQEILHLTTVLEKRVEARTADLTTAKNELESFSYAVSHDLQAPVRHITAYSQILLDEHAAELSESAREYLLRINRSGVQMRELITHLLALSRLNRQEINRNVVDLSDLSRNICTEMAESDPDRHVQTLVADGLSVSADPPLLDIAMRNLIGNAWKYTKKVAEPRIEIGTTVHNGHHCFYVRDNGTGFDMAYSERLFTPFQRLHTDEEYEGSGVGLATVMRIVQRHDGSIWAESSPGSGAVFYFTMNRET
ncbi:MAG TPA: ATP-binding protein [Geobacteraceae bacterium]|nr:ATP-binding protein [Geobacteraceae bacterium]